MFRQFGFEMQHEGGCRGHREMGRHGRFGGGRERAERGFGGGGRERLFDSGDLQLVILHLLSEEPSYGYQLIKKLEGKLAGGYAPSPGVVYPTLTMLEEEGLATVSSSGDGKKVYTLTEAGHRQLGENKRRLDEIMHRMEQAGQGFQRGRSPELMRAFLNLRGAVQERVSRRGVSQEEVRKVVEAINAAAKAIDEL